MRLEYWAEPGEGAIAAARAAGSRIGLPRPGEPFEPTAEAVPAESWWRGVADEPKGGWPVVEESAGATAGDLRKEAPEDTGEPETIPAG